MGELFCHAPSPTIRSGWVLDPVQVCKSSRSTMCENQTLAGSKDPADRAVSKVAKAQLCDMGQSGSRTVCITSNLLKTGAYRARLHTHDSTWHEESCARTCTLASVEAGHNPVLGGDHKACRTVRRPAQGLHVLAHGPPQGLTVWRSYIHLCAWRRITGSGVRTADTHTCAASSCVKDTCMLCAASLAELPVAHPNAAELTQAFLTMRVLEQRSEAVLSTTAALHNHNWSSCSGGEETSQHLSNPLKEEPLREEVAGRPRLCQTALDSLNQMSVCGAVPSWTLHQVHS